MKQQMRDNVIRFILIMREEIPQTEVMLDIRNQLHSFVSLFITATNLQHHNKHERGSDRDSLEALLAGEVQRCECVIIGGVHYSSL